MNTTCSTENSDEEIQRADERGEAEEWAKGKGGGTRADERARREDRKSESRARRRGWNVGMDPRDDSYARRFVASNRIVVGSRVLGLGR